MENRRLRKWFNKGTIGLVSAATSSIMKVCADVCISLRCPLILSSLEDEWEATGEFDCWDDPRSFINRTKQRAVMSILSCDPSGVLGRLPRIPLTSSEVKERLLSRYAQDENKALHLLASEGSVSAGIYGKWKLSRAIIKNALKTLSHNRKCQTNLCSILCATRFKYADRGGLTATICPNLKCFTPGCFDSFEHLLKCYELDPSALEDGDDSEGEEVRENFLEHMAKITCVSNPGIPTPSGASFELELNLDDDDGLRDLFRAGEGEQWRADELMNALAMGVSYEEVTPGSPSGLVVETDSALAHADASGYGCGDESE